MAETNERLEAAMEQRRVELRLSWRDVTRAAEMSYEGLRAIRRGERHPNAVTRARIESALQWGPGSVEAVLAGGEPTPTDAHPEPLPELDRDQLRAALQRFRLAADDLERLINREP